METFNYSFNLVFWPLYPQKYYLVFWRILLVHRLVLQYGRFLEHLRHPWALVNRLGVFENGGAWFLVRNCDYHVRWGGGGFVGHGEVTTLKPGGFLLLDFLACKKMEESLYYQDYIIPNLGNIFQGDYSHIKLMTRSCVRLIWSLNNNNNKNKEKVLHYPPCSIPIFFYYWTPRFFWWRRLKNPYTQVHRRILNLWWVISTH